MQRKSTVISAVTSLAMMAGFGLVPVVANASQDADTVTTVVTPNPWYRNGPFKGWGTSLAWFANATGNMGEEDSLTENLGDDASKAEALEYGKDLREQFYQSVFGEDGLDLNMARYNVGGGNASDVAYGYPFMRQGAAVPGTWADDPDGSEGIYGGVTTKQADKTDLLNAFDPTDDSNYDFDKAAAQNWWVQRGAETGDITNWEVFANSAPWFMTEGGYATGGSNASANNIQDIDKFAQYLAMNAEYLEDEYGIDVNTVEPLNESESSYWGTPSGRASTYVGQNNSHGQLIANYENQYPDANWSITPYETALKKPQEGMHVSSANAKLLAEALAQDLSAADTDAVVSSTDASIQSQFTDSYKKWIKADQDVVGQYNVHSYGADVPRQVRDLAQRDGKQLSMSEYDGDYQGGTFNPFGYKGATGQASHINSDVYNLQSQDWTFWQVVEDLYNMQLGTTDQEGNTLNPAGENLNWGTVFIDFDCTVAGADGKLYSQRRVDNNGGDTDGLQPCKVLANTKYNGMRAYTKFIQQGDTIIANDATSRNMTAESADGQTQTVVHTNDTSAAQTFVVDLSNYAQIADDATATLYLTTPPAQDDIDAGANSLYDNATPDVLNKTSNVQQDADAVVIDAKAKTATMTVPANSVASVQFTGLSGVAEDAPHIEDGQSYQLVGQQSGKAAQTDDSGNLTIENLATTADAAASQVFTFHKVDAPEGRPTLNEFVISNTDGTKVLNNAGKLVDGTVEDAKSDQTKVWIVNTEDGVNFSFVNGDQSTDTAKALDVSGANTSAGTAIDVYTSNGAQNQAWVLRSLTPLGVRPVYVQTAIDSPVTTTLLPGSVTPYYSWGDGSPVNVSWDLSALPEQVKTAGTYEVRGSVTDIYGNALEAVATVYVGALSVTNPGSVTVAQGVSADDVKALAPETVSAHVGDSQTISTSVQWQLDGLTDEALSRTGKITVVGTADDGAGGTIDAVWYVFVTEASRADGENLAQTFCSNATASATEGSQSAARTCDGSNDTAWSNWGTSDTDPTLTYTFDAARSLNAVELVSYGEATPSSFTVQYRDQADGTWKDTDPVTSATTSGDSRGAVYRVELPDTFPATDGVRLKLAYYTSGSYAKVAEVNVFERDLVPSPAVEAHLADLRVDGVPVSGFDPDTLEYQVDLAGDATEYPTVSAYAQDSAAQVVVEQASVENGGKATVTVTAADGTTSDTYTVDFGALPTPVPSSSADTLVVKRGNRYYFKDSLSGGAADRVIAYGKPGDTPVVGDWDGDGVDTLAVKRGNAYYIKDSLTGGAADRVIAYGTASDTPVVGDWNGDGKDTLGLKRGNQYYIKDSLTGGAADTVFAYGKPGDTPVVGDWDGDGVDTLALKRGNAYYIKDSLSGGEADRVIAYGKPGDTPVVGDWDDDGSDTLAVKRGNRYYFKDSLSGGAADMVVAYGRPSDAPLSGCWLG